MTKTNTNALIHESSPYLLQHAHNPVDWHSWNDAILEDALRKEKLIIISIGYAACHWCHVMEEESFEDPEVAAIMNSHYVCIKVDREERPDIDQVYMNAVQLMTGSGGWPMNVVALPDGRPVWGGTYFKKEQWKSALLQIADLYKKEPEQLLEYAERLEKGLEQMQLFSSENTAGLTKPEVQNLVQKWTATLTSRFGGENRAPKFIVPGNWDFLLRYSQQSQDKDLEKLVVDSLIKIGDGGIYDHIGGGFSRYSVDEKWHIPHFEKMLYDNAQLVSLYSKAFSLSKNNWFKEIVTETLTFISEELTAPSGAYYSSLDADSLNEHNKLEEGAFYTWKKPVLQQLLAEDFDLFSSYYNINSFGKWENEEYVLIRTQSDAEIAEEFHISEETLASKKKHWQSLLKSERSKREKPRLDDKQLTSWNALMITAYLDAYTAFKEPSYLESAVKSANFICQHLLKEDFSLYHSHKNGESKINAYLEDYAFCIEAFLKLYELTLDEKWQKTAKKWTDFSLSQFYDAEKQLFYFTSSGDRPLISRNFELVDNVIPSSNSVMAHNLFKLHKYTGEKRYMDIAEKMLLKMEAKIEEYPQGASNWLNLKLNFLYPYFEVVVTGKKALENIISLRSHYLPHIVTDGATSAGKEDPLLKNRFQKGKELFYVCTEGTCQLPVQSLD